jgi:hypothetical protein
MIMWANQRRTLHGMEKALTASEPQLKATFAIFGELTRNESTGEAERMPPRPALLARFRRYSHRLLQAVLARYPTAGTDPDEARRAARTAALRREGED